ncbi:hypothetical protein AB1Y20_019071 [Prymnesium parvum]|uniref:Uncharacterized protein n=1 Tax=Prymnesium parvum TaxID=97485 RepID=A0AB34JTL5_PRYPA
MMEAKRQKADRQQKLREEKNKRKCDEALLRKQEAKGRREEARRAMAAGLVGDAQTPRAYLFQLPGEHPPRTADMSSWLQTQLRMVGVRAPPGFSYFELF